MSKRFSRRLADLFRRGRKPAPAPRTRPSLESLEDRFAPAVFNVNSLADVLNPGPGVVTLRSAIQAADTNGQASNTIFLRAAGTYQLSLPGTPGETDNAAGELAITGTGNLSLVNASGGAVTIDGGGLNRVFDVNPAAENTTPFTVTFQGITITDGNASPGDGGQGSGGGIRAEGAANIVLNNVVLTNNTATADGGGIALESANNDSIGTLTVNASVISNNHAGDAGGGIETDGTGLVTVNPGTLVTENTCVNQGAGIWLDAGGASLVVNGAVVSANRAITGPTGGIGNAGAGNVTILGSVIADNFSAGNGGGFGDVANMGSLTVRHSSFVNNTSGGNGGGIQESGPSTIISDSGFQGNRAAGNGGALFLADGPNLDMQPVTATAAVIDCLFLQNTGVNGGAIEDEATSLTVASSTFFQNRTLATNGGNGGLGGAINAANTAATLAVSNSLFLSNVAVNGGQGNGGAIAETTGSLTVKASEFIGNVADDLGGAVDWAATGTTSATISGDTFFNNRALAGGGAAFFVGGSVSLTNDTFFSNIAPVGGAVEAGPTTLLFLNDTINGNTASTQGGGVALQGGDNSSYTFQNTIVALNSAPTGPDVFTATGVTVTDLGGNLIGKLGGATGFGPATLTGSNPLLGPLQNNGGPAVGSTGHTLILQTEALLTGSPAIDRGLATGAPTTDERGFVRPDRVGENPDIGAFEVQKTTFRDRFVIGSDGQLYDQKLDANGNAAGSPLLVAPGQVQGFFVSSNAYGQPLVFVLGTDGQIYTVSPGSNGSYSLVAPSGTIKSFAVGHDRYGDPVLFAQAANNWTYEVLFNAWGQPVTGYFPV